MSERHTIGDSVTLFRGDCLEVMGEVPQFDALVTDPPYSSGGAFRGDRTAPTSAKYQSSGLESYHPDFTGDNRDQRGFLMWSALWLGGLRERAKPGALCVVFTDWRQLPTVTDAVQAGGWVWRGVGVWNKGRNTRPQLGRYRQQAEFFVWGTNGPRPIEGTVADGVFDFSAPPTAERVHSTQKSAALMRGVLACCGETIVDPFMGSGTTGLACLHTRRKFVGIEMTMEYFEIARQRLEAEHQILAAGRSGHERGLFGGAA